ncbi:peptidase S8 [Hymenobacter sedentarius]|uniref:Peptidase S8 n=1 Tax=Hymenobacter sedentarius TaxID=1411621 RepID=A0A0U4B260_9BACT|nr:S8/S53 family peptidase [Hymenobacter sedentarius]ALW87149.1 peptidase S8 [Hymenobacter sedentarius]
MKNKFIATLLLVGFKASTSFGQAVVDPELRAAFATSPTAQVVVTFNGSGAPQASQVQALTQLGITRGITMQALPIAGVVATAAQVDALAQNPEVRSLYINKQLEFFNNGDTNLTGVKRLRLDAQTTARNNGTPVSGRGIGVLINDSGVDGTHEDIKLGSHLVQNTLGSTNLNSVSSVLPVTYVEGVPNTDNNSGHGTHCAGTVGGNGSKSGGKYEGVAPGASLLGYGSGGALLVLDAIGGFDYALTHQFQYNIRVISNSFGSSGTFDPNDPLNVTTKRCYDRNMVVVFAAGNSGPGADTHNPYAIAPWTISVGAGDRNGQLASFSSRGVKGQQGTFVVDGQTWTYKNEPVITAPGVDVVSTRTQAPVPLLGAQKDAAMLTAAELPFYTVLSGTSMATPHTAGIVALILEAKPSMTPAQVKELLQKTATNMPGRESWEVGAGYVNAFAAVDRAFRGTDFGSTVNSTRTFNSSVNSIATVSPFTVKYNPATTASNQFTFNVASGVNSMEASISTYGIEGQTGNTVNLIVLDPTGKQYRSGIPVEFTLTPGRSVAVASPMPGTWTLKVDGLNGVAAPEDIDGKITMQTPAGTTNLNDIAGDPAEAAIKMAITNRLVDGLPTGYKPSQALTRIQLAEYLLMGQGIRQFQPTSGVRSFNDILSANDILLTESVAARGAAQRDMYHQFNGVMLPTASGSFSPAGLVSRASLAYSLVQALGFQAQALARNGKAVTVNYNGSKVPLDDAGNIPAGLEGYVSIALELNLINAYFSVTQGPYDLQPVVHATFKPTQSVSRGEFAVIVTRTFPQYNAMTQPTAQAATAGSSTTTTATQQVAAYPNPFTGSTTISYALAKEGPVSVEVFNAMGAKVQTLVVGTEAAGVHQVKFDAAKLARGTYLFKVKTGESVTTKRLVVQ